MRITNRTEITVKCMFHLALNLNKPVPIVELAKVAGVSASYVEQVFRSLMNSGLVTSQRGPGGGYELSRAPIDISMKDIATSVSPPEKESNPIRLDAESLSVVFNQSLCRQLSGISMQYLINVADMPF